MKLASLKHGRDGRLVVVSQDLTRATDAFPVVATLQGALDDWDRLAPRLADLAESLEHGSVPSFRFHEHDCASPLPRAYQRIDASPLRHGGSGPALAPREAARLASEDEGIDVVAGVAVVTGDVPMGSSPEAALGLVRLVLLSNDVVLRGASSSAPTGTASDLSASPCSAYSPVAVTPNELGDAWRGGSLHLALAMQRPGAAITKLDAVSDTDFGAAISQVATRRNLAAGTIIAAGSAAESAAALRFGDTVRVEMKDASGHSIFGAIEQDILPATTPAQS